MGSADVVPGVSGGTIARVLGIYERLVTIVHQGAKTLGRLVKLDVDGARREFLKVEWWWVLSLLAGIVAAVLALASLLDRLLEDHPEVMSAIFAGLVVASIWVAWGNLRTRDATRMTILVGVGVAAAVVLGFRSDASDDPAWWMLVGGGAVAICAGILPGISGSFTLLMFGLYDHVIGAIDERGRLPEPGAFAIGAPSGPVGRKEKSVSWLLRRSPAAMRFAPKAVSMLAVSERARPVSSITERWVVPGVPGLGSGAWSRPSRRGGSPARSRRSRSKTALSAIRWRVPGTGGRAIMSFSPRLSFSRTIRWGNWSRNSRPQSGRLWRRRRRYGVVPNKVRYITE